MSARFTEIGQPIGITSISRIELGTRRVDADDLVALAAVFGVSPNRLLLPATASDEPMELTSQYATTELAACHGRPVSSP